MLRTSILLAAISLGVIAAPDASPKIVGGSLAVISQYPYAASLLYAASGTTYYQKCAGTILTTTAVLSVANCLYLDAASKWRVRVGSSYSNSGGTVHSVRLLTIHPYFSSYTLDNDVAVLRTSTNIGYVSGSVAPASIAGASYYLADNQPVWAIGWGATAAGGYYSEQLRQVQIWSINQTTCKSRYSELGYTITDNMVCAGWLDVGGRDQCSGDAGGPLIHNGVIVGISSWGQGCGLPRYPGVNTRVSKYTSWIQNAAA